ncbi:MAG: hypothetical protein MJ137_07700 [Clostridia bacterium]|nr:hypothetical protein [Clostridia bacterium]
MDDKNISENSEYHYYYGKNDNNENGNNNSKNKKGKNMESKKNLKKIMPVLVIAAVIAIIILGSFKIVPTGYVGVKATFGQISDKIILPGFYFKIPFVETVSLIDTRQTDVTISSQVWGESSEKTPVFAQDVIITYKVNGDKAAWICSNVSENTENLLTASLVASSIKSSMVKLTADNVTVRSQIEPLVLEELRKAVIEKYGEDVIEIVKVVVDQMDFEPSYNEAIAKKSIARQQQEQQSIENATAVAKAESDKKVSLANAEAAAEAAKIKAEADAAVAKIQAEADADVARIAATAEADVISTRAEAQADANKKLAESLTDSVLKSQFYEAWDGKLPEVMSDGTVITNIGN